MGRDSRRQPAQTPAPGPAKLDDAVLETIAEETRRMGVAERIIYWDKRQGRDRADRILCTNDPKHGAMQITRSGAMLMCGVMKGGAGCTASMPVSV